MKTTIIYLLFVFFLTSIGLFQVKFYVRHVHQKVEELKLEIAKIHSEMSTLKAEWSYLSRPSRLQRLNKKYLNYSNAKPNKIRKDTGFLKKVSN